MIQACITPFSGLYFWFYIFLLKGEFQYVGEQNRIKQVELLTNMNGTCKRCSGDSLVSVRRG